MTSDEIKAIHAEEVLKGKSAKDAYNGVRTRVHVALAAENPPPYQLAPQSVYGPPELIDIHLIDRKVARALTVTPEHVRAYAEYNAKVRVPNRCNDPIHYAQKMHAMDLWTRSDAMVVAAIGAAP